MKIYFLFSLLIFTCFSCGKKYSPDAFDYYQVPHTMYFVMTDSGGNNLINKDNRNKIKVFYFMDNSKTYLSDFNIADSLSNHGYLCCTRDVAFISSGSKIKEFYIENGSSDIDTVFVDVVEEKNKDCMCMYPYKEVKFNGKVPQIDPNDQLNPYLFVK